MFQYPIFQNYLLSRAMHTKIIFTCHFLIIGFPKFQKFTTFCWQGCEECKMAQTLWRGTWNHPFHGNAMIYRSKFMQLYPPCISISSLTAIEKCFITRDRNLEVINHSAESINLYNIAKGAIINWTTYKARFHPLRNKKQTE